MFTNGGAVGSNTPVDFSPSGVAGGVIGGANLQLGQWIFGAELSFSGTGLSQSVKSPFCPATDTFSTELNWLATVDGRGGSSWDRTAISICLRTVSLCRAIDARCFSMAD